MRVWAQYELLTWTLVEFKYLICRKFLTLSRESTVVKFPSNVSLFKYLHLRLMQSCCCFPSLGFSCIVFIFLYLNKVTHNKVHSFIINLVALYQLVLYFSISPFFKKFIAVVGNCLVYTGLFAMF